MLNLPNILEVVKYFSHICDFYMKKGCMTIETQVKRQFYNLKKVHLVLGLLLLPRIYQFGGNWRYLASLISATE